MKTCNDRTWFRWIRNSFMPNWFKLQFELRRRITGLCLGNWLRESWGGICVFLMIDGGNGGSELFHHVGVHLQTSHLIRKIEGF